MILDITVPFENRADAFDVARKSKEDKYRQLAIDLSENMTSVKVEAIIVDALGFWDPKNDKII